MSLPDRHPDGFKRSVEHAGVRESVPAGFRQGTEPSRKFLVDLNTGLVKEHINEMERRVGAYHNIHNAAITDPFKSRKTLLIFNVFSID